MKNSWNNVDYKIHFYYWKNLQEKLYEMPNLDFRHETLSKQNSGNLH